MNRFRLFLAAMAFVLACSCTGVALDEQAHGHYGDILVRRSWPSKSLDTTSLNTGVLLARLMNEVHYSADAWDTLRVGGGEYVCMAYAADPYMWKLSDVNSFAADSRMSLRDVKASLDEISMDELNGYLGRDDSRGKLKDMATEMPLYVQAGPLYAVSDYSSFVKDGSLVALDMPMSSLTIQLTVNVRMLHSDDVQIEEVVGCVTGVPGAVYMMNSEVDATAPGKLFFNMEPRANGYSARLTIPGLLNSPSYAYLTGNGILHLYMTATCVNDSAEAVRRHFILSRNIKETMESNPLLKPSGFNGRYMRVSPNAVYNIPGDIKVTRQNILDGDLEKGLGWVDESDHALDGNDDKPVI